MLRHELSAYWGPRKEGVEACAARLVQFLQDLGTIDPVLSRWFEADWTKKRAKAKQVDIRDPTNAAKSFSSVGKRHGMPELGFSAALWNGEDDARACGLSMTCGSYASAPGLFNDVKLVIPPMLAADVDATSAIVAAAARSCTPAWAALHSDSALDAEKFDLTHPLVDWIVYLPKAPRELRVSPPARVVPISDSGVMVITQNKPVDRAKASDVSNLERVKAALRGLA